ncbi:MAG TPA: Arm DNA-binding domain-containing protein, partial [Xanthobacteraceae bacterium]
MPKLTAAAVRKYAAGADRREIPDALAPGLYLIIQPKPRGSKSWAVRFRRPDGRPAKLTLGPVDLSEAEMADAPVLGGALSLRAARELANKIDRDRARGIDIVAERAAEKHRSRTAAVTAAENTFPKLLREFYIDHRTRKWEERPRRWWEDARNLGLSYARDADPAKDEPEVIAGSLAERWRDRPISSISEEDIFVAVDESRRRGIPGTKAKTKGTSEARGRKVYAALSVFFKWAKKHRRIAVNPASGAWDPPPPKVRDRTLTDEEIVCFWKAADKIGPPYGTLYQLLLLTGVRRDEGGGMTRAELNGGDNWELS